MTSRDTLRDLCVFFLLLAIGVVGRWVQPDWNFTPLMAVTVLGGYYFRSVWTAALLPVAILTISNFALDGHDNLAVQMSVYMMMIVPLALGRWTRGSAGWRLVGHGALCGLVPATAFFVVTNFVHWAATSMYEHTWAGLANCYAAAVPFYRTMLAGDIFYLTLLAGCLALANTKTPELVRVRVKK
ncbi:MAG: DUF6580 family putative transport protein [Bythopirellula sp.]|nr:DUF6580 family putative transport protein [Bythopirellula sp.]